MRSSVISWFDRMESCMVLSTAEAKDVTTCDLGVCDADQDLSKEGVLA